eukprot:GDKJ01042328.1.p1 GENE.GDKJ01042328.1~~GDKJ01042328.1.p1  ORF type:complete len:715 (+),score=219.09 GDKJ01042328.1:151-2145(+)
MIISVERGPAPVSGCTWLGNSCVSSELPTVRTDSLNFALSVTDDIDVGSAWTVVKPFATGCAGSLESNSLGWSSLASSVASPALSSNLKNVPSAPSAIASTDNSWWSAFSRGLGDSQWIESDRAVADWRQTSQPFNPSLSTPSGAISPSPASHPKEVGFSWLEGARISVWAPKMMPEVAGPVGDAVICLYPRATAVSGVKIAMLSLPLSLFPGMKPTEKIPFKPLASPMTQQRTRLFGGEEYVTPISNNLDVTAPVSSLLLKKPPTARPDLFDEYFAPAFKHANKHRPQGYEKSRTSDLYSALLPLTLITIACAVVASLAHVSDVTKELAEEAAGDKEKAESLTKELELEKSEYDKLLDYLMSVKEQISTPEMLRNMRERLFILSEAVRLQATEAAGTIQARAAQMRSGEVKKNGKTVQMKRMEEGFGCEDGEGDEDCEMTGLLAEKKNYCESQVVAAAKKDFGHKNDDIALADVSTCPPASNAFGKKNVKKTSYKEFMMASGIGGKNVQRFNLIDADEVVDFDEEKNHNSECDEDSDTISMKSYSSRHSWAQTDSVSKHSGNRRGAYEGRLMVEVPQIIGERSFANTASSNFETFPSNLASNLKLFASMTEEQQSHILQMAFSQHQAEESSFPVSAPLDMAVGEEKEEVVEKNNNSHNEEQQL